jgi:hypothetical protein
MNPHNKITKYEIVKGQVQTQLLQNHINASFGKMQASCKNNIQLQSHRQSQLNC